MLGYRILKTLLVLGLLVSCGRESGPKSASAESIEIFESANQPPTPGQPAHQNPSVLTLRGRVRGNGDHGDHGTFYIAPGVAAELIWFYPISMNPLCTLKEGDRVLYVGTQNTFAVGPIAQRRTFQVTCPEVGPSGRVQRSSVSLIPHEPLAFLEVSKSSVRPGESFEIKWMTTAVSACELSNSSAILIPLGQVSLLVGRRTLTISRNEFFTLRCVGLAPRTQVVTVQ